MQIKKKNVYTKFSNNFIFFQFLKLKYFNIKIMISSFMIYNLFILLLYLCNRELYLFYNQ